MEVRRVAVCALILCAAAGRAGAQDAAPLPPAVAAAVRTCCGLTIFDHVAARLDGGAVLLHGSVTSAAKKRDVERRVAALPGVHEVRSHVSVLPPSVVDDELRYRVSRAIYGHPAFWSYAAMPHPPIHIIVENGAVTLAGTVGTQVERAVAGSLAAAPGRHRVINELEAGR